MAGLLFFLTLITLVILLITTLISAIKRKPVKRKLLSMILIIGVYGFAWLCFFWTAKLVAVTFGTNICFDDWCATVTGADRLADGSTVAVHITMANHALRIAQKPDDPRVYLVTAAGKRFAPTATSPIPLDTRLQLYQSLQTTLTFNVPKNAGGLRVLIEEGPFIANLVFPQDEQVFEVK